MAISVYGGTGFVGSHYVERHGGVLIPRNERNPQTDNVLYFISTTDNYNVFSDVHVDVDTNLSILLESLEACRKANVETFNFISSWFVYGNTDLPAKETSYCDPKGFYSITKRAAEQLLISYCRTFNMNYRILRLGNVVGKGDGKVSAKKNALQFLVNKMKNNEPIELYENGDFYRDYIHVEDCAKAINLVLKFGSLNEIYNIANGKATLFRDIIELAMAKTKSQSVITSIPQKDFHKIVQVKSMYLNIDKLNSLGYGYLDRYDIEAIVDDLIS